MQKSKGNVVIIDGYGFIFRAFFSLRDFKTSKNEPIGAVYGFINMLLKVINTFDPKYIIVIFDSGKKSFRSDIYPEYKAHRKEAPDDLKPQFSIVRDAVKAFNINYAEVEGFEADDLIATYAQFCKRNEMKSIIISSDKDLMQLAEDGIIEFYDPMKAKFITEKDINLKFGVKAKQIVDFLAIVGDSSDNIPGVAGIGEKGASELLNTYSNVEDIYNNLENITKSRLKNALEKFKENAFLSKTLATLKFDVNVPSIEDFKFKNYKAEELFTFLNKYELKSLIAKLLPNYNISQVDLFETQNTNIKKLEVTINDEGDFNNFINNIKDNEVIFKIEGDYLKMEAKQEIANIEKWWAE
jgi:DNA polymerase I